MKLKSDKDEPAHCAVHGSRWREGHGGQGWPGNGVKIVQLFPESLGSPHAIFKEISGQVKNGNGVPRRKILSGIRIETACPWTVAVVLGNLVPRMPLEVWLCNWSSSSPKAKKARRMEIASAPGRGGEGARGARNPANHSGAAMRTCDTNVRPVYSTCYSVVPVSTRWFVPPLATAMGAQSV